jgi:signal peptidase I
VNFIKRVVAGPGDPLSVADGHVVLNGKRQREAFFTEPCGEGPECDLPREITVPPDHWFMMGDNRGASDDSRFWGPVPTDAIVGRAFFRYWPSGRAGEL